MKTTSENLTHSMSNAFPTTLNPVEFIAYATGLLSRIPDGLLCLLARIGVAGVFWRSGQTKVDGWHVTDATFYLFESEYMVPLIPPVPAAYFASFGEHLFPLLLIIGLASRFSALALLGMTLVIQLFVYPGSWPDHAVWATALIFIMAKGPGMFSLDRLVARRFQCA